MRKLLLAFTLLCPLSLFAQIEKTQTYQQQSFDVGIVRDFPTSEYDHAAFAMTSYPKAPSAHALVLKEFGKAWITSNGNVSSLMFEYHVKIKLFDTESLKKGHVEIPYYIQDNGSYEEINPTSVQGMTYYASSGGGMSSVELSQDSVTIVKKNKHWSAIVFTMPKLSKGCIIEYKYRLSSPYLDKFKTWEFQSDIPKIYSEYEAHIPTVFGYNVSLRGSLKLSKDTVNIEKNCFSSTELQSDCNVEDYRIDNIPAFKPEPFVASPKSYMSALYFQLAKATMLNNSAVLNTATYLDVADNWDDADKTLRYDSNFGSQLLHSSIPKDKLTQMTAGITDTLGKAKAIYAYIQKNISFDGLYSLYTDNGIKRALDKHTGNSADINITLTAALKQVGINANAVLISTRDNITIDSEYPAISEFNSVIVAVVIGDKAYLLDATDSQVPFGMLPINDLNSSGWGRVEPLNKSSYWIKLSTSQRRLATTTADLTFDAANTLSGTITRFSKSYSAYERRIALTANKGGNQNIPGLTITKADNNATDGSPAITQTYQVQVSNQDKSGAFTFIPFMLGKPVKEPLVLLDTLTTNPFVSETRTYPVDFGMPASYSFTATLHLPAGYKIDTPPQNIDDSSPGIGSVSAIFNADGTNFTYTLTYSLDKAFYNVAEYAKLKALFDQVILAEKAPLTIKKQ